MELLRAISRWTHVIVGFTGLVAFWFPVFSRKGARLHRIAGKVFMTCGYLVTGSAALSCILITHSIYSRGLASQNQNNLALLVFLAYLAWVTFVTLRYSTGVLGTKKDPGLLKTPGFQFLAVSAIVASFLLIAYATWVPTSLSPLLYGLSPIGLLTGWPMLRYMNGKIEGPRAWFYEHMSATVGAGIAFHTAFAVFGAQRMFNLTGTGPLAFLPWLLPAALGIPSLALWQRHYRRKLGDTVKATKSPSTGNEPALSSGSP